MEDYMNVNGFYHILPKTMVKGDIIPLKTTREGHNNDLKPSHIPESAAYNFADALNRSLKKVNDQQIHSEKLAQQLVSDPESVSPHTVMIAAEKARMSLTFTKSVTDLAVKTYRDLVNMR